MERKLRASAAGVPEHIIQRGNNRQVVFCNEDDIKAGRLALFDTLLFLGQSLQAI
jgi:REP element-mobilizing transposase RayT|tara:strand:+ start:491 stop:655 length:165 start_codon:yes stop_codon:yes gene_type:complete